ncbi:fat storage-inducing transmembrane protein 1-like [Eucyclogobius newberryi]|uniref:fat storage-inducing transmembrane protein 1-like n=1 Tax=Eucyclogobius newberryi TaxID=166745 RepID=UPI003B5BA8AE
MLPEWTTRSGQQEANMNLNMLSSEVSLGKLQKVLKEVLLPVRCVVEVLSTVLDLVTHLLGRVLGSSLVRRHLHLLLSGMVLFGPLLSLWVSTYNIFANSNHFLYRKFLRSAWGWTCILTGSFILVLSLSARRSLSLCLRHLSRLLLVGLLWWALRRLLTALEDAAGTCYEPMPQDGDASGSSSNQPLLLLHEDQTKASCVRANMQWRGYEVSQDVLILCLCCLVMLEEISVFKDHASPTEPLQKSPGAPLRVIFLLCTLLLAMWMFLLLCLLAHFTKFPAQQLGGALGCLAWRGLYQGWFRLKGRRFCPGMPGEGLLSTDDDKDV